MRIKVKLINGEWVASSNFDGSSAITSLVDFYQWNIKGERACRENKSLIEMNYKATFESFRAALYIYEEHKKALVKVGNDV